jgi:chromosome segregation ATPase
VTEYIPATCPNCQKVLRVRAAYVGHKIACNHCNHAFRVEAPPPSDSGDRQRLEAELQQARDDHAAAQLRLTELEGERSSLEKDLRETRAELERLNSALTAGRQEAEKLQSEHDRIRQELTSAEARLKKDRERYEGEQQAAARIAADLREQLFKREQALMEATSGRKASEKARSEEAESRRQELEALQARLGQAEQAVRDVASAQAAKEKELGERAREVERLRAELEAHQGRTGELERAVADVASTRESEAQALAAITEEANGLRRQVEELTTARREARERFEAEVGRQAALTESLRRREELLARENQELSDQLRALRADLDRMWSGSPAPAAMGIGQPSAEVESLKQTFEQERAALQRALEQARREADALRGTLFNVGIEIES